MNSLRKLALVLLLTSGCTLAHASEWKKSTFSAVAFGSDGTLFAAVYGDAQGVGGKAVIYQLDPENLSLSPIRVGNGPMVRAILPTPSDLIVVSQEVIEMGGDLSVERHEKGKEQSKAVGTTHCISPLSVELRPKKILFECSQESDPKGAKKVEVNGDFNSSAKKRSLPELEASSKKLKASILDYALSKSRLVLKDSKGKELKTWSALELLGKP